MRSCWKIRPGIVIKDPSFKSITSIYSRIVSLRGENNDLIYAIPGGLIGVGLKVDPFLTRANKLIGKFLGHPGKLPEIYVSIVVKTHLLKNIVGLRRGDKALAHIGEIRMGEILLVNAGSTAIGSTVKEIKGDKNDIVTFSLFFPICSEISEKIAISRKIGNSWRLIGWGEVLEGGEIYSSK